MTDKIKIRFMRQGVLDTLKANLDKYYEKYYKESTNDWIYEEFDNPFEEYMEVDAFNLYPIEGVIKGKNTLENCKIVYENLKFIPENIAADERLWAGLCHDFCYEYIRERFKYTEEELYRIKNDDKKEDENDIYESNNNTKSLEKLINKIKSRFFFGQERRVSLYRNFLSKFWWVGYNFYDENLENKFEVLDGIGHSDISTNLTYIFISYKYQFNKKILKGIAMGIKHFRDNNIQLLAFQIKEMLKNINIAGGGILLDVLSTEEIKDMFIKSYENKENVKRITKKR